MFKEIPLKIITFGQVATPEMMALNRPYEENYRMVEIVKHKKDRVSYLVYLISTSTAQGHTETMHAFDLLF